VLITLPLLTLAFAAGYGWSRRSVPTQAPISELEAVHAGLGVDLSAGAAAGETPAVGPVSAEFRQRVEALAATVAADTTDLDSALELANLYQDAHQGAQAAPLFERVVRRRSRDRQPWLDLADSYGQLGQWSNVADAMQRMLQVHAADPSALYNLGVAQANLGDAGAARTWWTQAADQAADPEVARLASLSLSQLAN